MKSLSKFSQAVLLALAWMTVCSACAQAQAPPNQQFGKAMVENAAELRQYTFKQRTEVSMSGEVRSVRLDQVRFDLDGNLERISLTPATAEAPKARGLRGKVVAKKREEASDYVERLMSLARRYLGPGRGDLEKLSRKAEIWKGQGATGNQVRIQATDFVKSDDSFVWTLDAAAKLPVRMEARTELDGDPVTITAEYRTLPSGPNYVARAIVKSPRKELEVKVESFDYERN
jgi:hypothetical protein